jgi:RNA polymerase sigma-70 factor (ECF subfamily)
VIESAQIPAYWEEVVEKIQCGGESGLREGMEELYAALTDGVRARLVRCIETQSVEDRLHEILMIVLEAIRRGELREPGRLMGFVKTVTRRRVVAHIRTASFQRRRFVTVDHIEPAAPTEQNPERRAARQEQLDRARGVLRRLSARDREILERFYFEEQPPEQICREMKLTGTQFRLCKSRAIARCFDLVRKGAAPAALAVQGHGQAAELIQKTA